jgi:hypothetical protein
MAYIEADDIIRICAEVSRFGRKANYTFKGLPVVQWEFPTIGDFARARVEILQAVSPMMVAALDSSSWQRSIDPNTFEIDCHNVTFRLICKQRMDVPGVGPVGAAEMIYTTKEAYDERQRRKK